MATDALERAVDRAEQKRLLRETRNTALEEAAKLLLAAAIKIVEGRKRIPQVDLHTASVLEKYGNEIRSLKS